jgi:hypothetical protein
MPLKMLPLYLFLAILTAVPALAAEKFETWTDAQGKPFKGAAAAIVGPYALFSTGRYSNTLIRLHRMSPADCVRLYEALRDKPARALEWSETQSPLSRQIFDNAYVLKGDKIVKADLSGRPEPELFILVFGWHDHEESREVLGAVRQVYDRVVAQHPGLVEAVFLGVNHDAGQNLHMITESKMPWLVARYEEQKRMQLAMQFAPKDPPSVLILTRLGVIFTNTAKPTKAAAEKTMFDFEALLTLMRSGSAKTALDRKNYLSAVQPVAYRTGHSDPVLIASPFDVDALQRMGLKRVDAMLTIGADHTVTHVDISNQGGALADNLVTALTTGLQRAVFVAAVDNGKFVDSTYEFHLVVDR